MDVKVLIDEIEISDGNRYSINQNDIVVFVGPNNSGKSLALREINAHMNMASKDEVNPLCIKEIHLTKSVNSSGLGELFGKTYRIQDGQYVIGKYRIHTSHVNFIDSDYIHVLGHLFCNYIGAEGRLKASNPAKNIDVTANKSNPIHFLYDDQKNRKRISDLFRSAFSSSLLIDYRAGDIIPLHVGEEIKFTSKIDRVSDEYIEKIRSYPRLELQGDGMRSFAGILLESLVFEYSITLIDEPEAFLHPPQMRRIGNILSPEITNQLFISTHSSDILRGLLERNNARVRIIRLRRLGAINASHKADPAKVRLLWENPDLKYTNALEAIFHDRCVICENDSDCRFYNAIMDHLEAESSTSPWPDTVFVPCGGKAAMPKLATALRELGVPTLMVFDLDLLADADVLKKSIASLGGNWADFEKDWTIVDSGVRKGVKPMTPSEIKKAIAKRMDETGDDDLPKSDIQGLLKRTSAWQMVKSTGASAIPRGDASKAFARLIKALASLGVYVVTAGEIENFAPQIGKHGPAFVSDVLNNTDMASDDLEEARKFVKSFAASAT